MNIHKNKIIFSLTFLAISLFFGEAIGQNISPYITVDQFGYLPGSRKIAVIRDPQIGYDAAESFSPGSAYVVVDVLTGDEVFSGTLQVWNGGATDPSSGDKVWWFEFTEVEQEGDYYIWDVDNDVRSYEFQVSEHVYNEVLRHAVRTFFYQRAGFAKEARYAGEGWADGASHLGPLQDKNARIYNDGNNAATEIDVHGGWYDAGDYNKYSNWTANYVVDFMKAYLENPSAWGDDYNIPESGNGIPDILDEAKWGVDHLLRMQQDDGSVLSIVGLSHASPPSSAGGRSLYGTPNTSATLNTAAAFAIASKVYGGIGLSDYAAALKTGAVKAWNWAQINPGVIFKNNDENSGTTGLGAGQQETDDYGRFVAKMEAAVFLFDITGETQYRDFFDSHYADIHLKAWNFAYPFETVNQEVLLYYTTLPGATPAVSSDIIQVYNNAMVNGDQNFVAFYDKEDAYHAYIGDNNYTWGSNSTKALKGLMFLDMITYGVDATKDNDAREAAEGYIHYLHGINPLGITYLSNMYEYGGDHCVNEFYHTWFSNGSAKWDRVGMSTYGPPPGYLTGGPNPGYDWDGCCPGSCGGSNSVCTSESISPPKNQPPQKSYKDFNTSWPLNSWSVTENSCGYQLNYIRLLSRFVDGSFDCSGTKDGTAFIDACGRCAGGTTGITPVDDVTNCPEVVTKINDDDFFVVNVYPNPAGKHVVVSSSFPGEYQVEVVDLLGKGIFSASGTGQIIVNTDTLKPGVYVVLVYFQDRINIEKFVKK